MELRTDALGIFESPNESTIRKVIKASKEMPKGYLINLEKDINNYLSLSIGERNGRHSLTFKNKSLKVRCCKKLNNNEAIKIFNRYLDGDLSWYGNYEWEQTTMNKILENIESAQQHQPEP